ncbi:hypothetical protein P4268_00975 [Bacillus thuringiensis]|uniref:hypothetical protein n=1 Tax=Bacillus cereus group sp. BfR-BA-01381 TaxID=2920325 RepID=UPI001F593CEF|nr:hypothetical protein [Bacillus cereus group sp. BfR-BA-01381]MCU4958191.1 hypothetical protein [Bacillus cereus]MED2869766.1 hypothetical protein [Bacillus thuringiensis]
MEQINTLLSFFTKEIWTFLATIAPIIGIIITYTNKSNFDLIFETKRTRLLVRTTKLLVNSLFLYIIFQFLSFAFSYSISSLEFLTSKIFFQFIQISFILALFIIIFYIVLTLIKTKIPQNWDRLLKLLIFCTKKTGFILYCYFFMACIYLQALNYLTLKKDLFALTLTQEQATSFFLSPFIEIIFLIAILYLHLINQGGIKKYNYLMEILTYNDIKDLKLVHLYTKSENEWILVEENDVHTQDTVYIFKKDSEKCYKYTKVEINPPS